jgi:probable F420-dependent oxidoreductase
VKPRLVVVLSEQWTLVDPRDLDALVAMAVEVEAAGADAVMLSEHVVLGRSAASEGVMGNPRDYALPGNQDPAMPWPSSIVLLSAMAAATTRIRLAAAAIIAPLRHPLLLAKDLATLDLLSRGRLVFLPTVSWHRDEYAALGVPFDRRGELLDEHLAAWSVLWRQSPASFAGEHYRFDDVWLEPKPWRPDGPRLWFGGSSVHRRLVERLVRYGHGFNPLGRMTGDDLARIAEAMRAAGRVPAELELVGGMRGVFPDPDRPSELEPALAAVPPQLEQGYESFCFKPSQFTDDPKHVGPLVREVQARLEELAAPPPPRASPAPRAGCSR